jgi:hypothetical protein
MGFPLPVPARYRASGNGMEEDEFPPRESRPCSIDRKASCAALVDPAGAVREGQLPAGVSARYTAKSGVECGSLHVISAATFLPGSVHDEIWRTT